MKILKDARHTMRKYRTYWTNRMRSKMKRMSCGAAHIMRIISFPHKDNWRRKEPKK